MRGYRIAALGLAAVLTVASLGTAEALLESHTRIVILDDTEFTTENGVRGGTGTADDPYVISNWTIDLEHGGECVHIEGVESFFRIEHCHLRGANGYTARLVDVRSAEITGSCIQDSVLGILWEGCERCVLRDCAFGGVDWAALTIIGSTGCHVAGCLFTEGGPAVGLREASTNNGFVGNVFLGGCRTAIQLDAQCGGNLLACNDFHDTWCVSNSYNRWTDADGNGSFWSRHRGGDRDGDGVVDTSYRVLGEAKESDQHPAMTPFHPEAPSEWDLCINDI